MTFTYQTTHHPIEILTADLAILTARRADTAIAAASPEHSWQEHAASHQTKLKPFTKLQSTPDNSNLQGKSKRVRVIGSSKKIAESKVKNSFYCTLEHFNHI